MNGYVPDEEEAARLREQMWSVKTSSIKSKFETNNDTADEPKETPQPIDLEAEISGKQQAMPMSLYAIHRLNIINTCLY